MPNESGRDPVEERMAELRQDPRETNGYALMWLFGIIMEFFAPILLVMILGFLIWTFA